jgi:hypothetical protein
MMSAPGTASDAAAALRPFDATASADSASPPQPAPRDAERGLSRFGLALYPLLFAMFPALAVAAASVGTYRVGDLLIVLAAAASVGAVALAACAIGVRLLRRDAPLTRGALIAVVGVLWFFYYLPLQTSLAELSGHATLTRTRVIAPILLIASALVVRLALRGGERVREIGRILTLTGVLVTGLSAVRVVRSHSSTRARVLRSATWRQVSAPVAARPELARSPKRDVYLVILDGYPSAAVLRARFGFDNTPFLDSLRALGFTIPRHLRSNYSQTMLSVPSLLNFEHVTTLAQDLKANDPDHSIPTYITRNNRTARFLRERGYEYLLFPMQFFEATRDSPLATYTYRGPPGSGALEATQATELWRVAIYSTLLQKVRKQSRYDGQFILDELRALRDVPARTAPTFSVAHLPVGHRPFPFDRNCGPTDLDPVVGTGLATAGDRNALLGSIQCANRQVLGTVTELLRRSPVAPIIVLVGDHGTLHGGWPNETGAPIDSAAAERLSPLGAFFMPDGGGAMFADSVTHVNVFRNVLRYYFGAELPPASNEGFLNQAGEPFVFHPVDERVVLGG